MVVRVLERTIAIFSDPGAPDISLAPGLASLWSERASMAGGAGGEGGRRKGKGEKRGRGARGGEGGRGGGGGRRTGARLLCCCTIYKKDCAGCTRPRAIYGTI